MILNSTLHKRWVELRVWPQLVRFCEHSNEHARYLTEWIFSSDRGTVVNGDPAIRLNVVLKIEELCVNC
jgi:hypothetical protein